MKKIKLEYTQKYDFHLIGISTSEKEHKFIWGLNNLLGIQLSKIDDHHVYHKKLIDQQEFTVFNYSDDITFIDYRVIANKSENGILLEELRTIDYFLIINGEYEDDFISSLQAKLKSADSIQASFIIDPNTLKSKERLLG